MEQEIPTEMNIFTKYSSQTIKKITVFADNLVPLVRIRWGIFTLVLFLYILRVCIQPGWHIISYGLAIFVLNAFIGFLSPQVDPSFMDNFDDESNLPVNSTDEFKPFMRKVPEYKFWSSITKAVIISLFLSMFQCTNVPVFWPILVFYFITLFFLTMKRQIMHMIKYRYVPFTTGKAKYQFKQ